MYTLSSDGNSIYDVTPKYINKDTNWLVSDDGIYKTQDGGKSFKKQLEMKNFL